MAGRSEFKVTASERWWDENTVAIVTGANKGIGKAAAQILAENGLTTIVAARDKSRGEEAVKDIRGVTGAKKVFFEQLDLGDKESISKFADSVKRKYKSINILINNAGLAFKGNTFGPDEAKQTMDINFKGTMHVCEAIVPLMTKPGRIVNVGSTSGLLSQLRNSSLKKRFQEAKSKEDVIQLSQEWLTSVKDGTYSEKGWSSSMYGISKACEGAYTRVLSRELESKGIDVNVCHPGYVNTDMSSHRGILTPAQGADTPVWLALLAPQGISGKFFSDREERSY